MLSDTLCIVLHNPLVGKLCQFNLYRIHNIPLVHSVLWSHLNTPSRKSTLQLGHSQYISYISFLLSANIMACQVSNGQFCHINCPLYAADTSKSCSNVLFLNDKSKINSACDNL